MVSVRISLFFLDRKFEWLVAARKIAEPFDSHLQITFSPLDTFGGVTCNCSMTTLGANPSARWARLCRQALQYLTQPSIGFLAVGFGGFDQVVYLRTGGGTIGRAAEQPCLAPDHKRFNCMLCWLVVDR